MHVSWTLKTILVSCLFLGLFSSSCALAQEPYTKPLWFDVVNHNVKIDGPYLEYDLQSSSGNTLRWGPLTLQEDFFSINLSSRQKLDAESSKMAFYNQEDMVLFFNWPQEIIPDGELEVTNSKGALIWKKSLRPADIKAWKEKITQVKEQLRKQGKKEFEIEANPLLKKTYAFFRSKDQPGPDLKINENYKFCLKNTVNESFARICTPFYTMRTLGTQIELAIQTLPVKGPDKPMVTLQNGLQKLAGKVKVDPNKPIHFAAQLKSGALIEFVTKVPPLRIYDLVRTDDKNPDNARLVGQKPAPVFLKSLPLKSDDPFDPRNNLWKADYTLSSKKVFLPGEAGGFFQYDLKYRALPKESFRVYANSRQLNTTYNHEDTLKVQRPGKKTLDEWTTLNPEAGQWNRSYLVVKDEKQEYKAYLDIYRGYPGELSLRLTGLASSPGKTAGMAEFHLGYWFNSLAGWDQYYLSRQRWGVSLKYLNLLSPIQATTETGDKEEIKITSTIFDVRYRFTPGLWERDETWGALLSYENLTYADYKSPRLGAGLFWARPMPLVVDRALNFVSFLRYPKWVDLELIKYAVPLSSTYKLGDDYAIHFHGKVEWSPRFYGEAGFGLKKVLFTEIDTPRGGQLNTLYGTLGVGFNF